jgi:hypothetical protein
MSKKLDDFIVAVVLYEIMRGTPSRIVADRHRIPYATIQQWEKKYTTVWVLNTLAKGGEKI